MSDQMINAPFSVAQEAATRLNRVFAQDAQRGVDDMFQRMANANESTAPYNKNDYMRLSFDTKNDAVAFANDIGGQGVNVNVAPVKLNGQWLVEIPKDNTVYSNGTVTTVTADELIDNYVQSSGKEIYEARSYDVEKPNNAIEDETKELGTFMRNNLDDLGKAISGAQTLARLADSYGSNANDNIFTKPDAQFNSGKSKTATVINGDTVIIDGKIVTDQKIRDYVLKQHNERMQKAANLSGMQNGLFIDKSKMTPTKHESQKHQMMRLNARKIQENMYGSQEYLAPDVKVRGGLDGGALDEYVDKFNIGAIAGSGKEAQFLNAIKGDLGLSVPKGIFSRADVLKFNQAFFDVARTKGLNIAFVDVKGNFNVNALKLSSVQKAFSKETLEFMGKLNAKDAWGGKNRGDGLLMRGALKLSDDEELQKLVQGTTSTVRYTKQASTTVHQFSDAVRHKADSIKSKKTGLKNSNGGAGALKKPPKPPKTVDPKTAAKNEKKFIKKNKRLEKKLQRSEKGLVAKGRKMYDRVVGKIARSKPARALSKLNAKLTAFFIKAAAFILLATLFVGAIIVLAVAIVCLVESLINFVTGFVEYLPSYFNKSAAYHLVKKLKKEELNWINGVEKFDEDFIFKTNEMTFGADRQKLEDYVNNFDGELAYVGVGVFSVNPFHKLDGEVDFDDYLKANAVSVFNGDLTVGYSSNVNAYGYRGIAENGSYIATESGHTSNIKDIIAMTDVMFNLEMNENSDEGLENVLGETPFKLKCKEIWNNVTGFFKAVGHNIAAFFKNLFGGGEEDEYITIEDARGGKPVSYGTLQTYALHLFTYSHTNQVDLSVSYLPVGKVELNVDGEMIEWTGVAPSQAAALGVCTTPIKYKHKIFYDATESSIAPYLESDTGIKYNLSTYDFGTVNVHTSDFAPDGDETLCLQPWFKADYATWQFIASKINANGSISETHPCWKISSSSETPVFVSGTSGSSNSEDDTSSKDTSNSENDGYYSTKSEAYEAAKSNYNKSLAEAQKAFESLNDNYILAADWNKFTSTRYVNNFSEEPTVSYEELEEDTEGEESDKTKKYKATVTSTAYYICTETLTRDCKGHNFEYCGGHVNLNSQGVIFSMTNEQMALGAAYNSDDEIPVVKDFDFEAYGYGTLQGKHVLSDVDFSTAHSASITGGSPLPTESVQGSDVANRGMNLYVSGDNIVKKKYSVRDDIPSTLLRDIFDVDCMIDKGGNAFPWGSHYEDYEGWSEDNMSLALSRTTIDWLDTYGTDVNIELDRKTKNNEEITGISTTEDLNNIIESLRVTYGDDFTEEREAATRLALSWLGRGHYSEQHKDHAFLTEMCVAAHETTIHHDDGTTTKISYDANCTASDDEGLIKFILNRTGKLDDVSTDLSTYGAWSGYGSTNDLLPADIIRHKVGDNVDYTDLVLKNLPNKEGVNYVRDVLKAYTDERYVFVVGVLGEDVKIQNRAYLTKGTLLTIDLQLYDSIGTIRLHTGNAASWDDVGYNEWSFEGEGDDMKIIANSFLKNYYWVTNPDASTKRLRPYTPPFVA